MIRPAPAIGGAAALAIAGGTVAGLVGAPQGDSFNTEVAAVVATAVATLLLAVFTAILALSTRTLAEATKQLAETTWP